jgi:hypothetical protein
LTPGSYVITVSEPVGGPAMPLFMTAQRFEAGAGWVNWPTSTFGGWAHPEQFGSAFSVTPDVSMISELSLFRDGFETADLPPVATRIAAPIRPVRKAPPTQLAPRTPR